MEYRVVKKEQSSGHLQHAWGNGREKGAQNKNHKYLARAWIQNKWRYAYTQAEVAMLQNWGKGKDGGLADQKKLNDAKRNAKEAKKQMEKTDKAMAKAVSNSVDRAKGAANVAAGNAKKAVDTAKNKTGEAVYKAKKTAQETAFNVAKTAKEKANDVKTGVAAQQVGVKAKNAMENLKEDLPKAAKSAANTARETAKKASEAVSSAAKSAKKTAESAVNSAKKSAEDFKNYASNVRKDEQIANERSYKFARQAEKSNTQTGKDTWNKRAEHQKDLAEAAKYERENSVKYKMSDLLSKGKDSDTYRIGKDKVDKFVENKKKELNEGIYEAKKATAIGKEKASKLLNQTSDAVNSAKEKAKDAASRAYDKATDQVEKVRESDAMATASKAVEKAKDKASDAAERVADRASDAAASAKHVAEAAKARAKYGADSLQYNEAKALIEHDRATEALRKARDKYGVNSPEYKQAAEKERAAMSRYEDAREENLYTNNKQYRETSNQASAIGSRIDAIDANGGPKTPEGRATYQRLLRELNSLESKLESLRR